jgi:hypothetical protein
MQLNLIGLTDMLQYVVWGTSPMPLMHVMVVYTMSMMNLLTFAKARPAQMIFITTSYRIHIIILRLVLPKNGYCI